MQTAPSQQQNFKDTVALNLAKLATLKLAKEVLRIEAAAVLRLSDQLGDDFCDAANLILHCQGRVVVSGMGKSGHVGNKIAATLASTGTPAFFMHAAEASHGDLGMVTEKDIVLALSNSGETNELITILPLVKRIGAKLISMTGNAKSTLAKAADIHLDASVEYEACPLGLSPTASTTAALALGDALAVTVLDLRGFSTEDFARSHPGGTLGRKLLVHVRDVMRHGNSVPSVLINAPLSVGLMEMTQKSMGMTAIVDANGKALGIFTDGDLRRIFERGTDFNNTFMQDVMHPNPQVIHAHQLAVEAVEMMEQHHINALLVVDDQQQLVGAININDLLLAKVV